MAEVTLRCIDCGSNNVAEVANVPEVNRHKGGRVPYGFYVNNGNYAFEPFITGPTLAEMMRAHAQGITYRALSNEMNAHGVKGPAGGEWSHSSVRRVVEQGKRLSHLIPLEYVLEA